MGEEGCSLYLHCNQLLNKHKTMLLPKKMNYEVKENPEAQPTVHKIKQPKIIVVTSLWCILSIV